MIETADRCLISVQGLSPGGWASHDTAHICALALPCRDRLAAAHAGNLIPRHQAHTLLAQHLHHVPHPHHG